jgi:hypothetical protein
VVGVFPAVGLVAVLLGQSWGWPLLLSAALELALLVEAFRHTPRGIPLEEEPEPDAPLSRP